MTSPIVSLDKAVALVQQARKRTSPERSTLAAISGIDGSGKGYVAEQLRVRLSTAGINVAVIGIDAWLNLPAVRIATDNPGPHFYQHAIRFGAMFEQLVLPLQAKRSLTLEFDAAEETANAFHREARTYHDVDIILLEGVFLLQPDFMPHYDLSIWIECSFETALERAIARGQEGLSPETTTEAYRTIYFPAQRFHFERDRPQDLATVIVPNDPRIGAGG